MSFYAVDLGADNGFADITLAGVTNRVDVWELDSKRAALAEQFAGRPLHEFNAAAVEMIAGLGFPAVSHRMASAFLEAVYGLAKSLEKKTESAPGSPDSTASTPSTGPTEN